mmetsp:Transcript_97736/g.232748  ORF Transcript_97736/g.232748 Transcript_97736/m.232748 type:complete len:246 (+) Transcript_97736:823-1560(+)
MIACGGASCSGSEEHPSLAWCLLSLEVFFTRIGLERSGTSAQEAAATTGGFQFIGSMTRWKSPKFIESFPQLCRIMEEHSDSDLAGKRLCSCSPRITPPPLLSKKWNTALREEWLQYTSGSVAIIAAMNSTKFKAPEPDKSADLKSAAKSCGTSSPESNKACWKASSSTSHPSRARNLKTQRTPPTSSPSRCAATSSARRLILGAFAKARSAGAHPASFRRLLLDLISVELVLGLGSSTCPCWRA